jgi:hypothetical protein
MAPPAVQAASEPATYVLEARMMQCEPNGKGMSCQAHPMIAFCASQGFRGSLVTDWAEAPDEYRKGSLQVKATPLKKELVRLEIDSVQCKAEKTGEGKLTLDMDVTPLMDRKVQVGTTVKKVLERDEDGTFRKWVELTVKEMQQAPMGTAWPPPALSATPAPAYMATPMAACQPPCLAAPPASTGVPVPACPFSFEGSPVSSPFAFFHATPPTDLAEHLLEPLKEIPNGAASLKPIPESKAYLLVAKTLQRAPDGKRVHGVQQMAFRAEPSFHGQMMVAFKEADLYRSCLLHVKATTLKSERLHLEVIRAEAKAENTNNGEIALGLDVKPLLDRQVKLGKTVKRVLERDAAGKPCKWVELMVKEMPQAATGAPFAPPLACQH